MKITRPLFLLFSPVYWLVMFTRNKLFDSGFLKGTAFDMPVIAIGNLSAGGTGKTPFTDYVARLVQQKTSKKIAILSRGYGRVSRGMQVAKENSLPMIVGDEPALLKKRLPEAHVVVDANRVGAIKTMMQWPIKPEVVVLDDAFQHRKLKAGFYILLTTYGQLYTDDLILPSGNLRESRAGASRAQCIIVTKCPAHLSVGDQHKVKSQLKAKADQAVFFTTVEYGKLVHVFGTCELSRKFLLVTGIANPKPLTSHLEANGWDFEHLRFPDHHSFSDAEIEKIIQKAVENNHQIITTEKDYQRLLHVPFADHNICLAYLPIAVSFLNGQADFDSRLMDFVNSF